MLRAGSDGAGLPQRPQGRGGKRHHHHHSCGASLWGRNPVRRQPRRGCWRHVRRRRRAVRQNCRPEGEMGRRRWCGIDVGWRRRREPCGCERGDGSGNSFNRATYKQTSEEHRYKNIGSFPEEQRPFFFFFLH